MYFQTKFTITIITFFLKQNQFLVGKKKEIGLNQGWANFLARGPHSEVEFVCLPQYSNC